MGLSLCGPGDDVWVTGRGSHLQGSQSAVRERPDISWQREVLVFVSEDTELLVGPLDVELRIVNKDLVRKVR